MKDQFNFDHLHFFQKNELKKNGVQVHNSSSENKIPHSLQNTLLLSNCLLESHSKPASSSKPTSSSQNLFGLLQKSQAYQLETSSAILPSLVDSNTFVQKTINLYRDLNKKKSSINSESFTFFRLSDFSDFDINNTNQVSLSLIFQI
ncbi:hypothetical protein BB560_002374 [Smittium megazygosporum]|uniref:Uncharacterized protein n=1 Tax=Smittium megazygosporum TaxID=133381 RepID=A0A2T9ZF15_9FUNG|nr:hypothetical protein BB560_002374 [Smittium megazygosporum]